MLGLALAAVRLAERRVGYGPTEGDWNPGEYMEPRSALRQWELDEVQFSREYYRIIDRIARGERP